MRVLAVQMSDDLFDKLGEYVKEIGGTKQKYINELVRKELMSQKQVQEVNQQKVCDRENVEKSLMITLKSMPVFLHKRNLKMKTDFRPTVQPAQYCQRRYNEIHGIEEMEPSESEYVNHEM